MASSLLTLSILVALVYLALCALLYWRQESFIFFPRANEPMLLLRAKSQRVEIRSPAGTLEGWWTENPRATTNATILYFGGNAEDVLYTAMTAPLFNARRFLVVNYRGYGSSRGAPSQRALYEDGLAIFQYAITAPGVDAHQVFVMGRSLGSGVASMLAAERPIVGAILVTPFDSLAAVAGRHYGFLPVGLLLKHPFRSDEWARKTRTPALLLAAERDNIIPAEHAERLKSAWAGPSELHVLSGAGHNDIEMHTDYYALINTFIEQTTRPAAQSP